ncbi:MAG: carbohydrate ABC transporter permease [Eubacteriales bacterium]|nr:carbohydrate ABC transporter permease [Eubacteriales bacterium]
MSNTSKKMRVVQYVIFILVAITMIAPFIYALAISLQGPGLAYKSPPVLFKPPFMWSNYTTILTKYDFVRYFGNTLLITAICMIGGVISNSMIGFGFAKYDSSKGINALFNIGLCTMYVPSVAMMIPMYVIWAKVGALDTYIPLTLAAYFGAISWIFLIRQNYKNLPNSFFEAAYIDGANPFYIWWKIYMPLIKPIIATVMLRIFMQEWNNLQAPLLYITTKSKYTVSLAMAAISGDAVGRPEIQMAGAVIMIIPVIIVYMFAQRQFIGGLAAGGDKG